MRTWTKQWAKGNNIEGGRMAYVVKCHTCSNSHTFNNPMGLELAAEKIPVRLKKRGWYVGETCDLDVCPACLLRAAEQVNHPKPEIVMPSITAKPNVYMPPSPAEVKPAVMSRADRRVVFSKLEEVYTDESTGYTKGWGDQKVATDLGVPRAWVSTVREENFGPDKSEDISAKAARDQFFTLVKNAEAIVQKFYLRIDHVERELAKISARC